MNNLWHGRFEKPINKLLEEFNASIYFDIKLFREDIEGSIAHVTMLQKQGIVNAEERDLIIQGLKSIEKRIENKEVEFSYEDEDIHMAIESLLIKEIGDVARKLHTGRSRNDQVALDVKLYLKKEILDLIKLLKNLEHVLVDKAEENIFLIMPGYTHLQQAQPISAGFYFMAYFQQFKRDIGRLEDCLDRMDYNPLGAGALAGTTIPIDRQMTTKLLGFKAPTENAMDTVGDRDHIIEFISSASIIMTHLSRMAEEFIIWNSQEFSYISIDDSFCTGSSIMPQKKNPDIPELIRGKASSVYGNLMSILTMVKGTPMAYNKDFQDDKKYLFNTLETIKSSLVIFTEMIKNTNFNEEIIEKQISKSFLNATDLAEMMVMQGIPFRTSHEIVGKLVKYCENNNMYLEELSKEEIIKIDSRLEDIEIGQLDNYSCVERRKSIGSTGFDDVKRQIDNARIFLEA